MTILEKKKYNVIRVVMNDTDSRMITEIERFLSFFQKIIVVLQSNNKN